MSKPALIDFAGAEIAQALRDLTPFRGKGDSLAQTAFDFTLQAATIADWWRRDHTETNRRRAQASATAAVTLCVVAINNAGNASNLSRAIEALSGALIKLCEGDAATAVKLAHGAQPFIAYLTATAVRRGYFATA